MPYFCIIKQIDFIKIYIVMNLKFSIDMCLSDKDHFFLKYVMYWIEKI